MSEWWVSFVGGVDVGDSFPVEVFHPADLSPFALGDGLSDDEGDGWDGSHGRWREEHLWLEQKEREGNGTNVCVICSDVCTLGGGEWSQSWQSEESLRNGLFDGEAFSSGNVRC